MTDKFSRAALWMLAGGFLIGGFMFVVLIPVAYAFPMLGYCLNAPAQGLAWLWRAVGLPPQGEAAFALPAVAIFLQWFVIGALVGLWRCRKSEKWVTH